MSSEESPKFHWVDYLVFGLFLLISASVGIIVGFRDRKRKQSSKDFLTGGGQMHWFPVSLSMMASFLSAVFVLSVPAEIYFHGTTYSYLAISYFTGFGIAAHVFMPVFYKLGVTSGYQYLEMRYNKAVRVTGSLTFSVMMILYMSVVLYTPSLALAHVSGMKLWISILAVGGVVTLYTTLGGMKATVYNDAFQMMVIFLGFILMIIFGSANTGGLGHALRVSQENNRLRFDSSEFDPNPFLRTTFWTVVVGGTVKNLTLYASSQASIQKFLSCKNIRSGQIAVWLSAVSTTLLMVLVVLVGCIMYAYYQFCDPLRDEKINKKDELIPLFVLNLLGYLHGVPGLLIAACFSASLSTLAGGINALTAVFLEDITKPLYNHVKGKPMAADLASKVTRGYVVFFGLLNIALAFLAEFMGDLVLQIANSVFGMVGGPLTGVFILGIFFPFTNSWGAMCGLLASLGITCWIGIAAIIVDVPYPEFNTSVIACPNDTVANFTTEFTTASSMTTEMMATSTDDYLYIYNFSYMYYALLAAFLALAVGIPVSLITGGNKRIHEMDPRLFIYFADRCVCWSASCREKARCGGRPHDDTEEDAAIQQEPQLDEPDEGVEKGVGVVNGVPAMPMGNFSYSNKGFEDDDIVFVNSTYL